MNPLALAWRNVWRNRRRSVVTMLAMGFGLVAMISYAALITGYLHGMERNVLDLEVGDVQVFALDYQDRPSLYTRVPDPAELVERLEEAGHPASARLLGSGLAAAGDNSAGVALRGVDVERDRRVSQVGEHVEHGQWLDAGEPTGVVLGRRLANILGVSPGDELVVVSQAADGSMANELFEVRGILRGIADNVDRAGVYMTTDAFRELMELPDGAHQLIVRRLPGQTLAETGEAVRAIAPELDVMTWRELMPMLASMLDSSEGAMIFMFVIVCIAIGIVILNAVLMAVFERIREFGVLKALGVGPGTVLSIIVMEVGIMTALATCVGMLCSWPLLWYLTVHGIDLGNLANTAIAGVAWDPVWRASVQRSNFVIPLVTLWVVVGLATTYPAMRAAFVQPVEAMRHH
jgi:putative ABC transport system permease protein